MEEPQGHPLIAIAEGIEAERQAIRRLHDQKTEQLMSTLENLIRCCQADGYAAAVLRWLVENGGLDGGAELDAKKIANNPWVLASERTVRRAILFWQSINGERGHVLNVKENLVPDAAGRWIPRTGTLNIDAIRAFLVPGEPRSIRPTLGLSDRPSDCQTDPRSIRPTPPTKKNPISATEHQTRQELILQQLRQAAVSVAPTQTASHDHDTIDIHDAHCHSPNTMIHDHGDGDETAPSKGPVAVAATLESLVARFGDPKEQKSRLVARIQAVICDPMMNPSIARAAADLVVFHAMPPSDLEHILVDVEAMREAGNLRKPGAFFLAKVRELATRWESLAQRSGQGSREENSHDLYLVCRGGDRHRRDCLLRHGRRRRRAALGGGGGPCRRYLPRTGRTGHGCPDVGQVHGARSASWACRFMRKNTVFENEETIMVKTKTKSKPSGKKALEATGCRYVDTRLISLDLIDPSPYQPRMAIDEGELLSLAGVIARVGFLDAIWVRQVGERYELLDGDAAGGQLNSPSQPRAAACCGPIYSRPRMPRPGRWPCFRSSIARTWGRSSGPRPISRCSARATIPTRRVWPRRWA